MGKKALDNFQIDKLCKKLFGEKWGGCYPIDEVPVKPYNNIHYFIVNTSTSKQQGEHWLGLSIHGHKAYIYDSYGRHSENIYK